MPCELWPYDDAWELTKKQRDYEMWTQGIYFQDAIMSSIGNAFRKKGALPHEYYKKPLITQYEDEHRPLTEKEKMQYVNEVFDNLIGMQKRFEDSQRDGE